ncbi:flavodoxin family protein [Methanoplanus sp. FWC-SCC4]|uniref:Flavodoxin family protein n=1 Tax=Methanochimaera problematica TaxID=2609417 RepID=A0AA97F9E3_9EURY|nr:flavodoxin family protein [Methanoplanus sp. FWC-SCC4]WOF15230.1 flavodoxin family protein [Methanoplanus sp. FWC-SCC4]
MIKVTGISGSPKKYGNTEKLLDSFLEGAESAGAATEKILLKKMKYRSCQGCNACHKTGYCVITDDLTEIFEKIMNETDILVLASPIYSMSITAEMKAFIDRGQYLWARKFIKKDLVFDEEHLKTHKGVFVSTAGQDIKNVFDAAHPVVRAFFNDAGFEYYKDINVHGMDKYKGIDGHPSALTYAYGEGKKIVSELSK